MKKLFLLLISAAALSSCSSGPESAARNFTESMAKGQVKEAKKFATEPTGQLIDFASGMGGLPIKPNFEFKMVKDSVVNNMAWVTYSDGDGKKETVELVKIDGKWLVNIQSKK